MVGHGGITFVARPGKLGVQSSITEDGSLDRKGNPAVKKKTGGWNTAILLLVNYGFATFAFFGLGVNLVLFLTRVMEQTNAEAANNVSIWTGTVYICSLFGAFMSDSYWGRYLTCAIFQVFYVMGLLLLSLTSMFFLVIPDGCGDNHTKCEKVSTTGTILFYVSIYMIAFGNGGYQPCIVTLGADQFDENDQTECMGKISFFSYFYFAMNIGCFFSNTVLVYFEDTGYWTIGFFTSAAAGMIALITFLSGTVWYRHFKPCGNPLTRIGQVVMATGRKWNVRVSKGKEGLYEVDGRDSAFAGIRKIKHSDKFRFLDKAATITPKDGNNDNNINVADETSVTVVAHPNPWRLCTVTQVEEVKCVLKMLPIWLCTIMYSVVFTQMASIFVEQGAAMNTSLYNFEIPPASMSVFDIFAVLFCILFYRNFIVTVAMKFTSNPRGLSEFQRMGTGLIISILAMVTAGIVELFRRSMVDEIDEPSKMSIFWQVPQYVMIGSSEVFMYVGQLEFFNGQAPDGIKSFGSSLCMASISLGNYVSFILVVVVMKITARNGNAGWVPENLNTGNLERFYFLLAILTSLDFVIFVFCTKWYRFTKLEEDESDNEGGEEMVQAV